MRRLILETSLLFRNRFPAGEPVKVWYEEGHMYSERDCGCGNRTTEGGGDGITELCFRHALPEPEEEESLD